MRRLAIVLLGSAALVGLASPATAQTDDPVDDPVVLDADEPAPVDVLQVDGFLDDILVTEIGHAIDRAVTDGSQALILQVDSRGAVVDERDMIELLQRIADSPVTIGVWVGPSGARLYGQAAQMLGVADVTGMAPGARVGHTGSLLRLPDGCGGLDRRPSGHEQ